MRTAILREFCFAAARLRWTLSRALRLELTRSICTGVSGSRDRELAPPHPIYYGFYRIDSIADPPASDVPDGRTWERAVFTAQLRSILDDAGGRWLINWYTDMGDGVEWSNGRVPG